jgi:hypothetical protein
MGTDHLEQITRTLLYEGYLLWPYRRSAIKNRRRWTIGGVYPADFEGAAGSGDSAELICDCLVEGDAAPVIDIRIRFLHRVMRQVARWDGANLEAVDELRVGDEHYLTWDEAVERQVRVGGSGEVAARGGQGSAGSSGSGAGAYGGDDTTANAGASISSTIHSIGIPAGREEEWLTGPDGERAGALVRSWEALDGVREIEVERLAESPGARTGARLHRVRARLVNLTSAAGLDREAALGRTFIAAHLVLGAVAGEFVSLLEPPAELAEAVSSCRNVGCWPVLVGEPGERHTILASPVIVYDYPMIAPESPGDLFDGTEIDQLLILNLLGLTEAERAEVRASDPRARELLERSENLAPEEMLALFGAIREYREVGEGER